MDIGQHCFYCGQLDFLPLTCTKCKQTVCGDHRTESAHECPGVATTSVSSGQPPTNTDSPAGLASLSLDSKPSNGSSKSQGTKTSGAPQPRSKSKAQAQAQAANRKQQLNSGKTSQPQPPKSRLSERAAATLARLKMSIARPQPAKPNTSKKHQEMRINAIGDFNVPINQRKYYNFHRTESEVKNTLTNAMEIRPSKTVCMFIDEAWVAGRALDKVSQHLAIKGNGLEYENTSVDLSKPLNEYPPYCTFNVLYN